jgi:hypothetical protein
VRLSTYMLTIACTLGHSSLWYSSRIPFSASVFVEQHLYRCFTCTRPSAGRGKRIISKCTLLKA